MRGHKTERFHSGLRRGPGIGVCPEAKCQTGSHGWWGRIFGATVIDSLCNVGVNRALGDTHGRTGGRSPSSDLTGCHAAGFCCATW